MPLKNVFKDSVPSGSREERQKLLYQRFGVIGNPFPSAAQTSGHPHMPTQADDRIDAAVKAFYDERNSQAIAITASQGIGKTNLLNAYEKELREVLSPRGFFVIRYMADPEPSFDPLIRSILECLHENDLLYRSIHALAEQPVKSRELLFNLVRVGEVKTMLSALLKAYEDSEDRLRTRLKLAERWLLGLPIRKEYQIELGVQFRLDTVESKTRALRDLVYFCAELKTLEGIFLLLDELEKQGGLSKTAIIQYLSGLRALIDALPKYFFLMLALTPDALNRYREMLPALKGRLANVVELLPLQSEDESVQLMRFYTEVAREEAKKIAKASWGQPGKSALINEQEARSAFRDLLRESLLKGVRQREYLERLHNKAQDLINAVI
ncbi:MAG TPA: hypothetical protein V6D11_31620 [Waterburya sp.]|jgi:hypothetical protein